MPTATPLLLTRVAQLALGFTPLAFSITVGAFAPALVARYPFFWYLPLVMLAARFGAMPAGALATATSTVLLARVWLRPELRSEPHVTIFALLGFVGLGLAVSMLHARLHDREERLRDIARIQRERAAELESALQQVQASDRAKDDFLATLSHELRTPLNVVLGYARMLCTHGRTPRDCDRYGRIIERNAKAQLRLVEDLLDVQRIASGRLKIERTEFACDKVAHTVCESLRPQAEAKGIRLLSQLQPIQLRADMARFQQVLWNLLSNAIKFTPAGGCISLSCEREGDAVVLRVVDSGEGIPAHFLPHVFERFRQLDSTATRRHFGMGLGLAIVKEVVHQHGGTVTAASEGSDKGATFVVTLPGAL